MIRLPEIDLPEATSLELAALQSQVDGKTDYAAQVAEAKKRFSQANTKNNKTFRVVRGKLAEMCSGARRCCYCEDSCADEVEHMKPKDLYPQEVFVWGNYVYACGICNGPKNNQFAVFSEINGAMIEVTRKPKQPIAPPIAGKPAFIDPRQEDALELLDLDLADTFRFLPMADPGTRPYDKADFTIRVLRLNERDYLVRARKRAYEHYRAHLKEYISERDKGASPTILKNMVKVLQHDAHPTVWAEMKRQKDFILELKECFTQAPEALLW